MADKTYLLFVATYDSLDDAVLDLAAIKEIKREGEIRDVTAALVTRTEKGRIRVHETTHAGKVAGGVGVVGGVIIGAIFPPAGLAVVAGAVADGAVLGAVAGAAGHFLGGISRKDVKQLGDLLDVGEAALVAVAVDSVATDVDAALTHAAKKANKAMDKGDVDAAIDELEKGVGAAAVIAGS